MPQWGNTDTTGNSVLYAPAQVKVAPNSANRDALYKNTTANAWFGSGETVGMYGVDGNEMEAVRAQGLPRPAHAGWVLRTTGAGGRANRISDEVLVAMHITAGGAGDEDVSFPDYGWVFDTQPADATANSFDDDIATFDVTVHSVPDGGTASYQWQKWTGSAYANVAEAGAYSNVDTATLSVLANTASNGEIYRCEVYEAASVAAYSDPGTFTIYPLITITTNPDDASGNADNDDIVTFTVAATTVPASQDLAYVWQKWGGSAFANLADSGAYSNSTTVELSVLANVASNGEIYRCGVYGNNNLNIVVYSSNAEITITTA